MADVFRGPTIFRTWRRDPNSIGASSQQYILVSNPAVIPQPPPPTFLTDWPNPKGPRYGNQDWSLATSIALSYVPPPPPAGPIIPGQIWM